jgi:hypothetical protein
MKIFNFKLLKLRKAKYPVCPECGRHTLVMFTPPKKGAKYPPKNDDYANGYVDWNRAHLYCCAGDTSCKFDTRVMDLTTPLTEKLD